MEPFRFASSLRFASESSTTVFVEDVINVNVSMVTLAVYMLTAKSHTSSIRVLNSALTNISAFADQNVASTFKPFQIVNDSDTDFLLNSAPLPVSSSLRFADATVTLALASDPSDAVSLRADFSGRRISTLRSKLVVVADAAVEGPTRVMRLRGACIIRNRTFMTLQLALVDDTDDPRIAAWRPRLLPGDRTSAPLRAAHPLVVVRPDTGAEFQFSAPIPLRAGVGVVAATSADPTAAVRRVSFRTFVSMDGDGLVNLILSEPLSLVNALPCDVSLSLSDDSGALVLRTTIFSGSRSSIFGADGSSRIWVHLKSDAFKTSNDALLFDPSSPSPSPQVLAVESSCGAVRAIDVAIIRHRGAAEIVLFASAWLVNETGLPLFVSVDGAQASRAETSMPFSESEARGRFKLRLETSDWSPPLTAHASADVSLRSEAGKFDLTFRASQGDGVFARTRFLTVTPRVRVVNQLSSDVSLSSDERHPPVKVCSAQTAPFYFWNSASILRIDIEGVGSCAFSVASAAKFPVRIRTGHVVRVDISSGGTGLTVTLRLESSLRPLILLKNETQRSVAFLQSSSPEQPQVVAAGVSQPFGWDDPDSARSIAVVVDDHLIAVPRFKELRQSLGQYVVLSTLEGASQVIAIRTSDNLISPPEVTSTTVTVTLKGIGLSLLNFAAREIFYACAGGVQFGIAKSRDPGSISGGEVIAATLTIASLQADTSIGPHQVVVATRAAPPALHVASVARGVFVPSSRFHSFSFSVKLAEVSLRIDGEWLVALLNAGPPLDEDDVHPLKIEEEERGDVEEALLFESVQVGELGLWLTLTSTPKLIDYVIAHADDSRTIATLRSLRFIMIDLSRLHLTAPALDLRNELSEPSHVAVAVSDHYADVALQRVIKAITKVDALAAPFHSVANLFLDGKVSAELADPTLDKLSSLVADASSKLLLSKPKGVVPFDDAWGLLRPLRVAPLDGVLRRYVS